MPTLPNDTPPSYYARIKALLQESGMQKQELAAQAGVTPSALTQALSRKAGLSGAGNIIAIAEALGVTPDYLLLGRTSGRRSKEQVVPVVGGGHALVDFSVAVHAGDHAVIWDAGIGGYVAGRILESTVGMIIQQADGKMHPVARPNPKKTGKLLLLGAKPE